MRAHYLDSLIPQDNYILLVDESLHHLLNVVRLKIQEELLLLNGKGLMIRTIVEHISRKELFLKTISTDNVDRSYYLDLVLCMPKRDALELCLKEAAEIGFENIYLIKSDYSQMKFPDRDRANKLLISAVEQSNAPFTPHLFFSDLDLIPWSTYQEIVLMDSQSPPGELSFALNSTRKTLIVGPEGGFSINELTYLHSLQNLKAVFLPTPILRTPTAVAVGAGMMIQSLLN